MDAMSREDLLYFLNAMLEAERAGAKALLHIARDTKSDAVAALAKDIHRDEARWCAMLTTAIRKLDGDPSSRTGQFYEKVVAIPEDNARLSFVNRGQEWVVRKLREALPKITDPGLSGDLSEMLSSHQDNIARVARSDVIN
jgi:nitronate monooxygenase